MVWTILPEGRLVRIERELSLMSEEDLTFLNRMIDFVPIYLALTDARRARVVEQMRVEAPASTFSIIYAYWIGWIHCGTNGRRVPGGSEGGQF
jgi:hypothetical protein